MKTLLLSTLGMLLGSLVCLGQANISPKLAEQVYSESRSQPSLKVWVQLNGQLDALSLSQDFDRLNYSIHQRRNHVISLLKANHEQEMAQLLSAFPDLNVLEDNWLGNLLVIQSNSAQIKQLQQHPLVRWMELTEEKHIIHEDVETEKRVEKIEAIGGIEPGLAAINAPKMWARGYTGKGRKALIMDSGLWIKHPAISSRWMGNRKPLNETWYAFDSPKPRDKSRSHGTHVCGTVLGLDTATQDTIGVAFNAMYMGSDPVSSGNASERKGLYNIIRAFEWALDPDGDTSTIDDMPDVINNSWGHEIDTSEHICTNPFGDAVEACQLAGIAVIWSAGNNGPNAQTIGAPATVTKNPYLVFTVGAVNANTSSLPIASFSSRGPTYCLNGADSIKPEVVAPGVSVRSSVDSVGYDFFQGTSMASPHVSGAVLLLKEAFPYLPGERLLEALYLTATDLGPVGEENAYGNGFINVDSAFLFLSTTNTPKFPVTHTEDVELVFIGFSKNGISCSLNNEAEFALINSGSKTYGVGEITIHHKSYGKAYQQINLTQDLKPGDTVIYKTNVEYSDEGTSGFYAEIRFANQPLEDYEMNNSIAAEWDNIPEVLAPFRDDFAPEGNMWVVQNPDVDHTWNYRNWDHDGIQFQAFQLEFFAMLSRNQQKDYLNSPAINLLNLKDPYFEFEYAYASKLSSVFVDSMRVEVRSGCSAPWQTVFNKSGADLATRADTASLFIPLDHEWEKVRIDLSEFDKNDKLYIRFVGQNGYGNNFYLNFVEVGGEDITTVKQTELKQNIILYPNPNAGTLFVEGYIGPYTIKDLQGRTVQHGTVEQQLDVSQLDHGIYFFNTDTGTILRWIKQENGAP